MQLLTCPSSTCNFGVIVYTSIDAALFSILRVAFYPFNVMFIDICCVEEGQLSESEHSTSNVGSNMANSVFVVPFPFPFRLSPF